MQKRGKLSAMPRQDYFTSPGTCRKNDALCAITTSYVMRLASERSGTPIMKQEPALNRVNNRRYISLSFATLRAPSEMGSGTH